MCVWHGACTANGARNCASKASHYRSTYISFAHPIANGIYSHRAFAHYAVLFQRGNGIVEMSIRLAIFFLFCTDIVLMWKQLHVNVKCIYGHTFVQNTNKKPTEQVDIDDDVTKINQAQTKAKTTADRHDTRRRLSAKRLLCLFRRSQQTFGLRLSSPSISRNTINMHTIFINWRISVIANSQIFTNRFAYNHKIGHAEPDEYMLHILPRPFDV